MQLKELVAKHPTDFRLVVETELRRLAAASPEFVYCIDASASCKYNGPPVPHGGGPSLSVASKGCIFGQALQNLGWDDATELTLSSSSDYLFESIARDFTVPQNWTAVQNRQDLGDTWSAAILSLGPVQQDK